MVEPRARRAPSARLADTFARRLYRSEIGIRTRGALRWRCESVVEPSHVSMKRLGADSGRGRHTRQMRAASAANLRGQPAAYAAVVFRAPGSTQRRPGGKPPRMSGIGDGHTGRAVVGQQITPRHTPKRRSSEHPAPWPMLLLLASWELLQRPNRCCLCFARPQRRTRLER